MARKFGKVQQLPSGNYRASFVGPTGERVFAPLTFSSAQDAETWLATQRTDIVRGTWSATQSGTQTLATYATDWLSHRTDLKPRTAGLYAHLLDAHIRPTLGRHRLRDITPAQVRSWHAALGRQTGPTARAQAYRLLRTLFNQAIRDGEVLTSPCQIRGAAHPETKERPVPTLDQIAALAEEVPDRYQVMVLVAAYGGLRFGELTALTRADINVPRYGLPSVVVRQAMHRIEGRWITGTPKSAAGKRTVVLPGFLATELTHHLDTYVGHDADSLVFATASGRPLARSNWTATFGRAKEKTGMTEIHFHDLRHAAATMAVQQGATLKDTMARLGHSSPRAALLYQHAASDRDQAIARALDKAAAQARAKRDKRGKKGSNS